MFKLTQLIRQLSGNHEDTVWIKILSSTNSLYIQCDNSALLESISSKFTRKGDAPPVLETNALPPKKFIVLGPKHLERIFGQRKTLGLTFTLDELKEEMKDFAQKEEIAPLELWKNTDVTMDTFIERYTKQYEEDGLFKNPWSKTKTALKRGKMSKITEVESAIYKNPNSRTAKVYNRIKYGR